jgi:protein-tyrosine phosphatase
VLEWPFSDSFQPSERFVRHALGRTGTLTACVLVALCRHTTDEAIAAVREARKGTVQTREQEDFVWLFEETIREGESAG